MYMNDLCSKKKKRVKISSVFSEIWLI